MQVSKNKVVTLTYELTLPEEKESPVVDKADESKPFSFVFGAGYTLEAFEKNLEGLKEGESFGFKLSPEEGYGKHNENAVVDLPKNLFEVEGQVKEDILQPGNMIPMQDKEGNKFEGRVLEVETETVKMDFNHPLAGKSLNFEGKIIDTRDASKDELDTGQVTTG